MTTIFPSNPPWFRQTNLDNFELKFSPIHGVGVFSKKNINVGSVLDTIKPIEIPVSLFYIMIFYYLIRRLFTKKTDNLLKFIFLVREKFLIRTVYVLPSLFSYCNDSIKPDMANVKISYEPIHKMYYPISIKEIKEGEEVLIRYE